MSQESYSYVVEAGGAIPSFISEAESVDNQGRPINSRLEQQQQIGNINNPSNQQRKQEQQKQIPSSQSQARKGPNHKEGKQNKNTQSQQIEQPFKREVKQEEQKQKEPVQENQKPVQNIHLKQFSQQNQAQPKQKQDKKKSTSPIERKPQNVQNPQHKDEPQQKQQRQKSEERNPQQPQMLPQPAQKDIKYKKTGEQRRLSQLKDQKIKTNKDQLQKAAQSESPEQNDKKPNILKKIRKLQASTRLLIRKVPFMRMVRRTAQIICDENHYDTPRFTYEAIVALQNLMETTMMNLIEDAYMISNNANRATLYGKDLAVLRRIRNAPWDYI